MYRYVPVRLCEILREFHDLMQKLSILCKTKNQCGRVSPHRVEYILQSLGASVFHEMFEGEVTEFFARRL